MIKAYALTDVGKTRSVNQDFIYCTCKPVGILPNLFIVADGMGGHKAGDLASRFSVETFVKRISETDGDNPVTIMSDAIKYFMVENPFLASGGFGAQYAYGRNIPISVLSSVKQTTMRRHISRHYENKKGACAPWGLKR